jgi:ketosteroid isomerase-like protein
MTRAITFLLLFAVAVIALAEAQANAPVPQKSGVDQALTDLENRWADALQKNDLATLNAILADTYVDTDEQGQRSNKQDVLSVLKSGELKFKSIKVSGLQVQAYGTAAVVTGVAIQDASFKGQPLISKVAFTDTFVKGNGNWRAVASHRSPIQGVPAQGAGGK